MYELRYLPRGVMTRLAFSCLLLGLVASGCEDKAMKAQNEQLQAEVKQLQDAAAEKEQSLQEVAQSLDSVQEALEQARAQELSTLKISDKLDQGAEKGTNQKEKILDEIHGLQKVLEQRGQELADLEARLQKSKGENSGLQKTVAKLRKLIAEREARIKDLEAAVNDRDARLAVMETVLGEKTQLLEAQATQIQEKDTLIQQQADSLNTGYFVAGSKDYLKSEGIIKDVGGVLGLGKRQVTSDLPDNAFRAIPIQQTSEIPLECPPSKVKLVSSHPPESFEILPAGEKEGMLKIKDAGSFWKTRYAVVLLKCEVPVPQ